ncbi:hypothetical protein Z042_21280 [Chania multitudinisentens RB-25]|uniref:NAD-dependent epimerase/dehydratase domain-containing protein n=1 Tax=Chania multitudinisentens RB-25 TaxID=1441930 RepID=W0LDR2_9GAMM|nr:NAD-dependent epimerase/dehydratase family protein [Chania multitudinisentens]AHG21861.1 hypothetical protein Z042_21280 [Chania multitudinisentens RB-25]
MHASVTGASGFIGRRVVEHLLNAGANVTILSRQAAPPQFAGRVRVIRGDLCREQDNLLPLLNGCDTLFHCAGELYRPELMEMLHVGGTLRLLNAAQQDAERRSKPLHWVHLSSVGAYGPPRSPNEVRIVDETHRLAPVSPYEITKTRSDELVIAAGKQDFLSYTIVRPTNVFGEAMTNNSLRSLLSMIRRRLFFYIGKTGAMANYVHIDDVVSVLLASAVQSAAQNRVFNVSNDCSLEELVEASAAALGVPVPYLRIPERVARLSATLGRIVPGFPLTQQRINALVGRTTYSSQLVRKELGIIPLISVADRARAMLSQDVS